jgi:hypothetical protein
MPAIQRQIAIERERWKEWYNDQIKLESNYARFGINASGKNGRLGGVLNWISNQVDDLNQSCLLCCVGSAGSGKSYSCAYILSQLDKNFGISNISFYPHEVKNALQEDKRAILIDDAGMQFAARDSMVRTNKEFMKIAEGLRFKNKIVAMTMPSLGMVDKNLRYLSQIYLQTLGINRRTQRVQMICRFLSADPKLDKIYYYCPIVCNIVLKDNKRYRVYERVETVDIPKPSERLIFLYEDKKARAFDRFLDGIGMENKKDGGNASTAMPPKYEMIGKMLKEDLSIESIANILDSTENNIKRLISYGKSKAE